MSHSNNNKFEHPDKIYERSLTSHPFVGLSFHDSFSGVFFNANKISMMPSNKRASKWCDKRLSYTAMWI